MKTCSRCNLTLPLDCFGKHRQALAARCKECAKAARRKYYEENKERILKNNAENWKKRKERYSPQKNARAREYYQENIDELQEYRRRYAEENREKMRQNHKNWYEKNKKRVIYKTAQSLRKRQKAQPDWLTKSDIDRIRQFYIERDIMSKISGELYHVDHIVPIKGKNVCGLHVPWNLQVIKARENWKKTNKFGVI